MNRAVTTISFRAIGSDERHRPSRPDAAGVTRDPSDAGGDEDDEEAEINRTLDRLVDFLATYLP